MPVAWLPASSNLHVMYGKAIMSFHCIDLARDHIQKPAMQFLALTPRHQFAPSATLALSFQNRVQMPITLMKLQMLKRTHTHTLPLATVSLGGGTDRFDRHLFFFAMEHARTSGEREGLHSCLQLRRKRHLGTTDVDAFG